MKLFYEQIGQLFIMGFPDKQPSVTFLDFIRKNQIGGVILFEPNCTSIKSVTENVETIKARYRTNLPLIAIDQEGGRVTRLKGAPAEFRSAEEYGNGGRIEQFIEDYSRSAVFMQSVGINLNLAPVCDLFLNPDNECLRGRCFSRSPREVADYVKAMVKVSRKNRLLSCLKHFPGLGAASIDPHQETSVAEYDEVVWQGREKIPFVAGVNVGADLIMTTHMLIPSMDDKIVTASEKVISELIRYTLSFDGPVITDDLTMKGAGVLGDIGERTVSSFNAGHDILLFGKDFESACIAFEYFVKAVERGEISHNRLETALSRISGVKFKLESSVLH